MTTVVDAEVRAWARILHDELATAWHEVVLAPAPHPAFVGHRIRTTIAWLPEWYRDLMGAYQSTRRDRRRHQQTRIKRAYVLRGLEQIAQGRPSRYVDRLLDAIDRERARCTVHPRVRPMKTRTMPLHRPELVANDHAAIARLTTRFARPRRYSELLIRLYSDPYIQQLCAIDQRERAAYITGQIVAAIALARRVAA